MINGILSLLGKGRRQPVSPRAAQNIYKLTAGHPHSDPDRLVDVTSYLSPEASQELSAKYGTSYRVYEGLPGYMLMFDDPDVPTVVAETPYGILWNHLNTRGDAVIGGSERPNENWHALALRAVFRGSASPEEKSTIVDGYNRDVGRRGDIEKNIYPQRPLYPSSAPGKYFRLVRTVSELPETEAE